MADMDITTLAQTIPVIISPVVAQTAADTRVFRPLITEFPFTGPGDILQLLTVGTQTAISYTENGARPFTTDTPTNIPVTPAEVDVAMAFSDKSMARSLWNNPLVYGRELGRAIGIKQDADIALEYANVTGTEITGGAAITQIELTTGINTVMSAAKDQAGPVAAVLHTDAWQELVNDTNVLQATASTGASSALTGVLDMVGGVKVYFTTAIASAGSPLTYRNLIFTKRTFAMAWKRDLVTEGWRDEDKKQTKIAAGSDYDIATWFAGEGVVITRTV